MRFARTCPGRSADAALGLPKALGRTVLEVMKLTARGIEAMEEEWMQNGTEVDKECFQYVRYGTAGTNKKRWHNGKMMDHLGDKSVDPALWDVDPRRAGKQAADFLKDPNAIAAELVLEHVVAIRLCAPPSPAHMRLMA